VILPIVGIGCRSWPADRLIYVQDAKDRQELITQKTKEQAFLKAAEKPK
jgi:hypothetical protein